MTAPRDGGIAARVKELANVVAPLTLITSLLLYFGYVGTRARLEYFGVYLGMTGLSNQDLMLSGLEVVYFPAAMVFLALLLAAVLHAAVTWLLTAPGRDTANLVIAAVAATLGTLAIARALVGLLQVRVSRAEVPGTTPLALALGPCLVAYAGWIGWHVLHRRAARAPTGSRLLAWYDSSQVRLLRRIGAVGVGGLLVAGLFWAANSFAWAFGSGRAYEDAVHLPERPEVLVDTRERLVDPPPGITETPLAGAPPTAYHYRYRGLRLLLAADGRLYLVPAEWTDQSRTLVVPYDDAVRIELIPRPG
jgi:hypothetical protein